MSHKLEPKALDHDQGFRGGHVTSIFNNDTNSFDEVVAVLMMATSCTIEEAQIETWEAHTFGRLRFTSASNRSVAEWQQSFRA
ncbi:MAG: ATP-dependent Clp protease adaptor ClpS [Armatimonadetes bacterium]|nr:ATP-dependent Clp protease adaptor ClpS [Armatimonadota bacterium]